MDASQPTNVHSLQIEKKTDVAATFMRLTLRSNEPLTPFSPGYVVKLNIGEGLRRSFTYRRMSEDRLKVDIDFHLHGDTPAGLWLESLVVGDVVQVLKGCKEFIPDLTTGKVLLCCDETGFAAMAALLENWQNPQPPLLLAETLVPENRAYFRECSSIPDGTEMEFLPVVNILKYGESLMSWLEDAAFRPDKVMATCSGMTARQLRERCETTWAMPEDDFVLRAYWNLKPMSVSQTLASQLAPSL